MPKLKSSGYKNAEETKRPGYLAQRMKVYRQLVEEAKRRQQENVAQLKPRKVKP